jgi:hypothetical protein
MTVISETEKKAIEQEARQILKKFSAALAKVKIPKQAGRQKLGGWREEEQGSIADAVFKETMLVNAPHHDANTIIAEKKKWS